MCWPRTSNAMRPPSSKGVVITVMIPSKVGIRIPASSLIDGAADIALAHNVNDYAVVSQAPCGVSPVELPRKVAPLGIGRVERGADGFVTLLTDGVWAPVCAARQAGIPAAPRHSFMASPRKCR